MATRTVKRNGSTRKWRETRARMLRQLPARCGICGQWITHPGTCDVDHIVPVEHGGTDAPSNLRLTHASCNRGRRVKPARYVARRHSGPPGLAVVPGLSDPEPDNKVVSWSRHWFGPANPRCPHCRE